MSKGIAVAKWGNGGIVARIESAETIQRGFRVTASNLVLELERSTADWQEKILRQHQAQSEDEAMAIYKQWERDYHLNQRNAVDRQRKLFAAEEQAREKLLNDFPQNQCDTVEQYDLRGYDQAQDKLLREKYPNVLACFDRLRTAKEAEKPAIRAELERAYVLDVAKLTGELHAKTVEGDKNFVMQVGKALTPDKRATGKAKAILALKTEILRGWWGDRYAFITHQERTDIINERLGTSYKKEAVRKAVESLGLLSKRTDGAPDQ